MGIILALFVFQAIPVTYADTTWPMYGGTLENTHFQNMRGAMSDTPYVKWSYTTGSFVQSHGAGVADIDGDDTMEVVIGSGDKKVYCLNGVTGLVEWSYTTGNAIFSSPAIADIDGDGAMEVVIQSYDHKVYCLNGVTGLVEWSYKTGGVLAIAHIASSPVVADIDRDGTMEVVIGSDDKKVYCLNGVTGLVEWSYETGYYVLSSPAVADIDGDGEMEIVIGSDKIYCLNGVTGLVEWSYTMGYPVYSSPAVADLNMVGPPEVVVGIDGTVYCLNGITGGVKWSFSVGGNTSTGYSSSPAVADVNGDDTLEVVMGGYCLNGATGEMKWSYNPGTSVYRAPSVADLDMDNKLEVLVPNCGPLGSIDSLICLNGEDGSVLWKKGLGRAVTDITVADIDNDGCVELVTGAEFGYKIWALDDVGNSRDCGSCVSIEERKREFRVQSLEFRVIGEGVYLFTPNAISVDIKLYDVCGRLKQILYKGVLSKGGHTFIPNIERSGIYFAVLRSHKFKESLKIIRF